MNYHPALSASPFVDALTLLTDARRELLLSRTILNDARRIGRGIRSATKRLYRALDAAWAAQQNAH